MAENTERDIFVQAHQLESDSEREAYINDACAGRPDLLERVKKLFNADAIEDGFLGGGKEMIEWLQKSYGHDDRWVFGEPMNKMTLKWVERF